MVGRARYRLFSLRREPAVNALRAQRNPRTVLTSTRSARSTLLPLATLGLLLTGCASGLLTGCASGSLLGAGTGTGTGTGTGLAGLEPGTTVLRVTNHVAAPAALDRITVTVDGEPMALSSIPPQDAAPAVIARLHLRPGAHTIAVRGVLVRRGPGSEILVVGAQQPFHVGAAAAAITIDVSSGSGDARLAEPSSPVAVSLVIQGGRMSPDFGVAPADDKDERCAGLLPIPGAICRAAVDLDDASRKNNIVAALCVRDKLTEMRRLAVIGDAAAGSAVAMAEAEVTTLSRQVELCAGDVVPPRPDGVTVTPPSRRQ